MHILRINNIEEDVFAVVLEIMSLSFRERPPSFQKRQRAFQKRWRSFCEDIMMPFWGGNYAYSDISLLFQMIQKTAFSLSVMFYSLTINALSCTSFISAYFQPNSDFLSASLSMLRQSFQLPSLKGPLRGLLKGAVTWKNLDEMGLF